MLISYIQIIIELDNGLDNLIYSGIITLIFLIIKAAIFKKLDPNLCDFSIHGKHIFKHLKIY